MYEKSYLPNPIKSCKNMRNYDWIELDWAGLNK